MQCVLQISLLYYLIIPVRLFSELNYDFEVPEDAPEGTLIGKITLETNLSYRLNGHNQFVSVDIQTGEIRTSASLDRETITPNGTIILFLTAEQERIITVRINVLDINDNSPTFPSRFLEVSIVESAVIGGRIRLQPASDPDLAENGTIVNYELKDEKEFFALVRSSNSTGGDVLLLELLAKLDRETKDLFVLNISAYDGGNPPRTGHCVVYVNVLDANDNPPTFRQSRYDVQLNESVQPDVVVLRVEATDADVGDNGRITYRFASNLSKHFQVDPDTGAISVQASGLDCPREDCLQNCGGMCVLAVEAEDHGDPKLVGHTLVYINLSNNNLHDPNMNFRTYPTGSKFASVSSETAVGSTVAVITTNDEDAGQNVRLSLVDGNNENYFRLENGKNYGILRQNRLVDKPIEQFLLKFRATDDGVPPRFCERTLTIFVLKLNDTAPILREKLLKVDIMENAAAGSFVAAIQALAEGELHFSIIENSANDELFSVGNKTGIVTLSQTWPNHTKWNYKVEVMIRKAAPSDKFSICIIQVAIIDVNDHEPQFSFPFYEIEVSEDAPPLSVIFKVTATDKDHGNNSVISYNMESSVKRHLFMVKESSGEVLLRKKLDRETEKQHKISITAVDHGTPSRSSTALLIINVLDVNDNDPYFAQLEYHGYIIRGDPAGTHLVQLEAFDDDSHQFSQISYLLYHTAPSFLELDHATGRMNLAVHADLLDFGQKIKVTVGAKDNGGRLSRNNATVHIWLLDSVRQIPQFNAANNWSIEINENSFPEKVLASFSVYPAAENIRYRINTTDLLIDEFTGHVRARRSFDREVEPRIGFTVYADGEWSTGMRQGTLKILDQNDNSPICELDGAVHFIIDARERDIGRELFRLSCYDPDDGPNGLVTYSINSNFFGIDSEIGIIRLLKFPDGLNQLQFHVTATDGGEQPRHSTIKVVVEIKGDESIYTFPPVITLCIPEDVPLGTILTNLTPKNTTQHFEFRTSANAENYPIQVLPSGEVFVASMIDYEILNHLSISVTAFNLEKKSISNKHDFLLQLYVEDINDNVPQCPLNSKFLIPENNIPGAIVGFFNAFDNDSGPNGTLFYELTYDSEKTFSIDPHIGIIRALSVLDFELAQFHNVTVIVTDGGLLRTECIVVVEVIDSNDNEPHWEQEYHHFYASSSIEDSFVGKVKAADLDSVLNGEVRYKLQQKWLPFKIDEISGILTRNGSLAPNHVYNITIIATDRGTPPLSSATFVFVHTAAEDDCIPNFINYPRTDIEIDNSLFGKVITQVHAVACGAEVLYSLSYGDSHYGSHTNFVLFWIDSIDGSIFLTEVIDAHIGQRLELIVKAETTSTSNNLTFGVVVIEKRNEKSGADANTIHIKENNNVNKVCAKIEAFGNSLQLLRQIPRGKTFHFEGQDLVCDEVLDREKVSSYRLVVAGSNDSMKKIISVQVDDENDNFPECFGTKAILVGSESSFIPWNCFDKDAGLNGTIGYKVVKNAEIVSEINDNGFTVSPFTGDLQHFSVLVYDRNDGVGYRDNDKLQKSIELHFILIPVNMGLRKQIEFQEQYRIDQDIQPGTVFGTIAAETGAVVEYFITSFKNEQHMDSIQWADVDRQTGQLRVNRRPDCGLANMEITILSEGFTKTITVQLLVTVTEKSIDNLESYYEFTIKEGLPVGSIVGRIANDGTLKFELLDEDDNFMIDKNGVIRTKNEVKVSETYLDIRLEDHSYKEIFKIITVLISVTQSYNNVLFCSRNRIDLMLPENSPPGTFVGILKVNSLEGDNYPRNYTLRGHPDGISVNSATGIITATAPFDYEKRNLYQFKALSNGKQNASAECYIFLYIIDRNDNEPKFSSSSYEVKVYEDAPVGQVLLQLEIDDLDTVNEFVYEISTIGNEQSWFGIKPDGRIFLVAPLDREHIPIHQLNITVYDQRLPEKTFKGTTTVKVIVLDVNDNAPLFVSPSTFFIFQGVPSGTVIGLAHAMDPDLDHNGQLQYRILPWSHPEGLFTINPVLGYLLVREQINDEEQKDYNLLIEAKDYGISERLSTVISVTIKILASKQDLSKLKSFYHAKIPENAPVGHIVSQLISGTVTNASFKIESGNEENYFRISPTNGTITTKKRLNDAKKSDHKLTISMRFKNNAKKQISIIFIEILNINARIPRFLGGIHRTLYVGENIQATYPVTIGTLRAVPADSDLNGTLSYSLLQGNSSLFRVTPQTGDLQITEPLDRESQSRYELVLQVSDVSVPKRSSSTCTVSVIVLDVNDNAPIFEQPQYYAEVTENEPVKSNEVLLCLKALDRDDREFSMIRYSLTDADMVPFSINSKTGCIKRSEMLDREYQSDWILEVIAHDNGNFMTRSSSTVVRIRVVDQNDNTPIILNEQLDVFIPNTFKKDDVIYILSAYDLDENDVLHYNLSGPDESYFQINQSGVITVTRELIKRDYSVTAIVSDRGNLTTSVGLGFYVSEAKRFPIFEKSLQQDFMVREHESNTLITKFIVQSFNVSSGGILLSIVSGDPLHHFHLDPNSGELFTTDRVDYEFRRQYELWIAAVDQHSQPMVSYANFIVNVVDINDNKPYFEKAFYSAVVAENGESNELIAKITAKDSDSGLNGKISYSFVMDDSNTWEYFKINEESGEIFTISGLDAEHSREYLLHVIAKDHGDPQLSETVFVKVEVLDKNDNSPRFSNLFYGTVKENSLLGTPIIQVTSYDADVNSSLIYGLEGNSADSFSIDQQTGWISLAKEVDREKRSEYSVKVKAWDGLWEVRTSLTIAVEDINDNAPVFSDLFYKFSVPAHSKIFAEIGQILAVDADAELNGQVRYDLQCNSDLFMVEPSTGHIFSAASLEEFVNNTVECNAFASDYGFPPKNSNATVYIYISHFNETNGTVPYYEFALLPGVDSGTAIGRLPFSDTVMVVNDSRFTTDRNGYLFTNVALTEVSPGHRVVLSAIASNERNPVKAIVSIAFTGPNTYRPQFSFKRYEFSIQENCRSQTLVGVVVANDLDNGLNGRITYRIIYDMDTLPFAVDPTTGTVITTGHVDYEESSNYHFLIIATDSGFPSLNDTAEVVVEVVDENDNVPVFEDNYVQYTISSNSPVGTVIAHLSAVDMDSGSNALIVYHLLSDPADELPFAINATFGTLYVSSEFRYETASSYLLRVLASNSETLDTMHQGSLPESFRRGAYSEVLQVEIFVQLDVESELHFPEVQQSFKISASALKGTIIGKVEAMYLNGNNHKKISYRMVPNDLIDINGRTGEMSVKESWNGTTGVVVVQIFATGQLSRNADFRADFCNVQIELKNTKALPVLRSHYNFSLSEDSNNSINFIILEHLPPKCRLEIVEDGSGYNARQPFCISSTALHLCGPVDYEQRAGYRLQIALIQDNIIRSRTTVTVTVSNVNDNAPLLYSSASIGYILENSPPRTVIMKLHVINNDVPENQPTFKYRIADTYLSQIFAINDTTGVVSSLKSLDREKRSLYILPITISDTDIPPRLATAHLRIYVDDQDDNAAELKPRIINLGYLHEIPDVIIIHTVPVDADQVGIYNCRLPNSTQSYDMSGDCALKLSANLLETDRFPAPLLVEASNRQTNITFPIKLRIQRDTLPRSRLSFDHFHVIIELWGLERSIADSVAAFEEAFPDMVLQLLGLQHLEVDLFRIFVTVSDRHLVPVNKDIALKLLKQFFAEKHISNNIHLKQLATDMCSISAKECMYGAKCSQNITRSGKLFELIGYQTTFMVPVVLSHVSCICENDLVCDAVDSKVCDSNMRCHNGATCQPQTGSCLCVTGYTGKFCENDIDECEDKNICGNGKCLNLFGSFICGCNDRRAVSSTHCNNSISNICGICRRGKCVKQNSGRQTCQCDKGYSGRYCQLKIRCFDGFSSSIHFPLHQQIFKLTQEFRTLSSSSFLLGSIAIAGINRLHFTLTLQNGQVHLNANSKNKKKELIVEEKVNDGNWKMIRLQYKHRWVKLTVEHCDEDGFCEPCKSTRCFAAENDFEISVNAEGHGQVIHIGGMRNSIISAEQVDVANFKGCMRQIVINEFEIDEILGVLEQNIISKDDWKTCTDSNEIDICSGGTCVTDQNDRKCICKDGFDALDCRKAVEPWYISNGAVIFHLSVYMSQKIQLKKLINASLEISSRKYRRNIIDNEKEQLREIPCEESEIGDDILDDIPAQWMELDFRTALMNTVIFKIVEKRRISKIELINGSARMITKMEGAQPMEIHIASNLNDIQWHRLSIQISEDQKLFRVEVDGRGKEIRSEEQLPTLISGSLVSLSVGDNSADYGTAFNGCFRRFIVNNQAQNFDALEKNLLTQQIFKSVRQKGARRGCDQFLMNRAAMSLGWKIFWVFTGLISIFLIVSTFILVLRIIRKSLSANGGMQKKRKYWKPKFWRFIPEVNLQSRSRHINASGDVVIQRALYCGPNISQDSNGEPQNSWLSAVHDLDANASWDSVTYQSPQLLPSHDKSNSMESGRHRRYSHSRRKQIANENSHAYSQSGDSADIIPATYGKFSAQRPPHFARVPNLHSIRTGVIGRDSSESETDSVIASQIPHSLAPFRPPRTIFAESEDSSIDGSLNTSENLQKLAQFPNFL